MKTICIDARFWGINNTGIGRYVENLIDNLPSDPNINLVLIVPPELANEPKLSRFQKCIARFHPYTFLSLIEMHFLMLLVRPDLVHIPHLVAPFLWPGKIVITVHDLIKHQSRGPQASTHSPFIYWIKYAQYLGMSYASISRASHVIVPSDYWREELIKMYKLNPDKITVTYEGVSPAFFKKPVTAHSLAPAASYIIYTGNLYPHKNIPVLIEAVNLLKGQVSLVVVCARSVFEERLPNSPYVKFLGRVSDDDLINLYQKSVAFVFPSLIEGFGLPGLEAMAAGTPVIAADASCLPEVYGDAALYFNPHQPNDLAQKIKSVLTNPDLRKSLIQKGSDQVKKYSWAKMANQTWQIYQKILQ